MYADAVNPAALIHPSPAETGGPIVPPPPVNPASVTPLFNLPDNGSKLEDKRYHEDQKYIDTKGDKEDEVDDTTLFKLIEPTNFYELLRSFLINGLGQIVLLRDQWRQQLGIEPYTFATEATRKSPKMVPVRDESYADSTGFYKNPPGKRFVGGM